MSRLIGKSDEERIVKAIQQAEKDTSGEIRVHIRNKVKGDIFNVARTKFEKLGMTKTELRNGVLIFVALKNRQFTILGDKAINDLVSNDFWASTVELMTGFFKDGNLVAGLEAGILKAGEVLKEFFPYKKDDINELSDEISFEE